MVYTAKCIEIMRKAARKIKQLTPKERKFKSYTIVLILINLYYTITLFLDRIVKLLDL